MQIRLKPILISLLFLFSISSLFCQDKINLFEKGITNLKAKNFSDAYENFKIIINSEYFSSSEKEVSYYYASESLIALGQIDGAAAVLKEFIENFNSSNYRDKALYRLGTIYFTVGEYRFCREKLQQLLTEYPESEYVGSSYYWIGESFVREGLLDSAEDFLIKALANNRNNSFIELTIFSLATVYELKEDYTNAIKYYDEILNNYFDTKAAAFAQLRIGVCYYKIKEFDHAVLELSDPLISELPNQLQNEAKLILANCFFNLKEFDSAKESYKKIINELKSDITSTNKITYSLAWVNFYSKKFNAAYNIFSSLALVAEDSLAAESLYWSAESKRMNNDYEQALKIYKQFIKKYSRHKLVPKANLNIAMIYYKKDELTKCETSLEKVIGELDSETNAKALTLLGEINLEKKKYSTALEYFKKAIGEINTKKDIIKEVYIGLGVTYYYLNNYSKSINYLIKLKDLDSRYERDKVCFYLGESFFAQGKYAKALNYYNQISFKNSHITKETTYAKAYSYFNLKDFPNAMYYFEEYIKNYPNDKLRVDAQLRLADCYFGIKDYEKSIKTFENVFRYSKNAKNNQYNYYRYAQVLFLNGESQEAVEAFYNFQLKFPKSKYADLSQYYVSWIYFQMGDYETSISEYLRLKEKYPYSNFVPSTYYHIGDAYYNLGKYEEAIKNYKNLIRDYPNTEYVFDAVNGLQYCYIAIDKPSEAVTFIDSLVSSNTELKQADKIYLKKPDIQFSNGEYQKSLNNYKIFIQRYPNSKLLAEANYRAAKSALYLKQYKNAIYYFDHVIENFAKSEVGLSAIIDEAKIFEDKNNLDSAIFVYDKGLEKVEEKNKAELYFNKAMLLSAKGDVAGAYNLLGFINNNYYGTLFADKARVELGIIEMVKKKYELSEKLFQEICSKRLDETGAKAQYYLGENYFEQNKIEQAITAFVRVRSIFSGYDEWYTRSLLRLGDAYIKLKEWKKAREMFRAVKQKHSKDDFGKEAIKKLKRL